MEQVIIGDVIKNLFICVALVGVGGLAQAQAVTVSPGQQVLRSCVKTYHSLREFKGGAAVVSLASIGGHNLLQNSDADFDFVRGQKFDITGHDSGHTPFGIHSTPLKTTTTWKLGGQEAGGDVPDITMAVASFTGVATLAPTVVSSLLIEVVPKFPFDVNLAATIKPQEMFGGHLCFVVSQKIVKQPGDRTFWIDTKTFLLRGMREENGTSSFKVPNVGDEEGKAKLPEQKVTIDFSSRTHIFFIEKTVPGEAALEAAAKGGVGEVHD